MKHVTIHTWITIGLPLYLIGFEFMLRHLFNVEISTFIGPSLGASGIGLLLECTKPTKLALSNEAQINELMQNLPPEFGAVLRSEKDEKLVLVSWVNILICSAVWVFICAKSIHSPLAREVKVYNFDIILAILLGFCNYIIGVVCLFSKEKNMIRNAR